MRKGLKSTLHAHIKEKFPKSISTFEIESIARSLNKKISNAERRLRPSESPEVETIRNEKGHITRYRWKGEFIEPAKKVIKIKEPAAIQDTLFERGVMHIRQ